MIFLLLLPWILQSPVEAATTENPNADGLETQIKVLNNSVNVRTALFKESDICRIVTVTCEFNCGTYDEVANQEHFLKEVTGGYKLCWSKHDLNLLIARRLVQDLLPKRIPRDFHALLKYFTYLLQEVRAKFPQKHFQIMQMALYDAVGGYLYSVVMPMLNEAFYAGNVDYKTVSQLHNMLGLMMDYLGTNGNNWAPPCDMSRIPTKVAPLPLKMSKLQDPCEPFVIPYLAALQKNKTTEEQDFCPSGASLGASKIQIPFLDDNSYPSAVAVPLKDHPLFSLMSECSVNIIPKFYIMAMRCLSSPPFTNKDVVAFNKHLHRWIIASVVPHLHETSRWYPGFGSVMRVVETMNIRGLSATENIKPDLSPPERCKDFPPDLAYGLAGGGVSRQRILPVWAWLLLFLIGLLLLLFLCCLIHCCIYLTRRKHAGLDECDSEEKVANPLVNIYCGLKKRGEREKGKRESDKRSSKKSSNNSSPSGSSTTAYRSEEKRSKSGSKSPGKRQNEGGRKPSGGKDTFPKFVFNYPTESGASTDSTD